VLYPVVLTRVTLGTGHQAVEARTGMGSEVYYARLRGCPCRKTSTGERENAAVKKWAAFALA